MTTIGIFAEKNGVYTGKLNTLTLKDDIVIIPVKTSNPKAPGFKLYIPGSDHEVGIAWARKTKGGSAYLSVILDDPSFVAPISARLIAWEDGQYRLLWNR